MSAQRRARQVGPTVAALRSQARETVDREFDRLSRRLGESVPQKVLDEARQALRRVATTILHTPTVRVKELTGTDSESIDYAAALTTLFDLDRSPAASTSAAQAAAAAAPTAAEPADAGSGPADLLASMGADVDGLMAMALSPQLEMTAAATTATPAAHVAPAFVASAAQGTQGTRTTAPASATASGTTPASAGSASSDVPAGTGAADGTAPVADHTLDVVEPQHPTGRTVRLGTRRSRLARSQSTAIAQELAQRTGWRVEIVEVVTEGDVNMSPLAGFGGTGVFVSAVRQALHQGKIDLAVHSLKDLPTTPEAGIQMAAIPPRVDPADVLIGRDGLSLNDLPAGSVIGTGSPRRAVQLRAARPDIEVRGVRGNVDTRIAHVRDGRLDAVVLAAAGVRRIGRLAEATDSLNFDVMLPAPGQGALAVETRSADSAFATTADILDGDAEVRAALRRIHDQTTDLAVTCERAILSRAEAGCSAPIGALAKIEGTEFIVDAVMADDDGKLARTRQSAELPALVDVDWSTGNEQQLTVTAKELARVADELGTAAAEDLLGRLGIDPAASADHLTPVKVQEQG